MVRNNTFIIKNLSKGIITFLLICIAFNCLCITSYAESSVNSSSIVIECESGRVLYQDNIHKRLPMASTTKIITALVVIENLDLSKVIVIPNNAVGVEGSSIYLKKDEKWKVIDLLYGLMLRSGNDAATALAIACGGTLEGFVNMMNDKANSLGLKNTNFTNPHGLHDENHYTTAYDLAMLTRAAMNHKIFREIVSCKSYYYEHPENYRTVFINKNKMLNSYSGANGVKTGYTKKSGRCLVSSAERNGMQLIAVTLNCNNMWTESMSIMSQAFSEYKMYRLLEKDEIIGEANIINAKKNRTPLFCDRDFLYPLSEQELTQLSYKGEFKQLKAPIRSGETIGKINIYLDKRLIFTANAYTIENVEKLTILDRIIDIFR